MNDDRFGADPFTTELMSACQKGQYVSVLCKGTYKYMSGKVVVVKGNLLKLENDKGNIDIKLDEIRSLMTYDAKESD